MKADPRSIPSPSTSMARPSTPARPRTLYLDPSDLQDLQSFALNSPVGGTNRTTPTPRPKLDPDARARLVAHLRADVRDAADAVLAWLDQTLRDDDHDPHNLLDVILRPGPDPAAIQRPALAHAIFQATGVELSPKRLATALRHLHHLNLPRSANPTEAPPSRSSSLPVTRCPGADPRPLALGLLAALRQAVARRTDRDYADALPDSPIAPAALEADALNYLRRALPVDAKPRRAAVPLHDLLLTLAPLTHPDAPAPTAESDRQLVLHAAPALAALLGPDSLPATLAHLNTLVLLRDHVPSSVYLAEMLRLTHHAAALKTDPDTASLHRFAKRHRLPNAPGATRVSSYAAVNACTRLLQRLFDGQFEPDTAIDVPPSWRGSSQAPTLALPLATALLRHLETTDAGFALTPTTRLLFHTVQTQLTGNPEPALHHVRKLGPTKTTQRLAALADHDNHDAMVAATAALAQRALPQLDLQAVAG